MFEQPAGKLEKDRSRIVMLLSGVAVIAVIALVVLVTSISKKQAPLEFAHAGTADFDDYVKNVKLSNIEKFTGERLNVNYGRFLLNLENAGDKTLSGLQLRLVAIDLSDQVKEKLVTVIPSDRGPLGPNQSRRLELYIEPIPSKDELKDMTIEVYSIKTQ